MLVNKVYWKVRDLLMSCGIAPRPRFYLRRLGRGGVRGRLTGRGTSRRFRRASLTVLLRR